MPFKLSADEIGVAFAILYRIFQGRIVAGDLHIQMRAAEPGIGRQYLFDDFDNGLVVKYPHVAAQARGMQPRAQHQIIAESVIERTARAGFADNAVKGAGAIGMVDLDRGVGAQQGVQIKPRLIRKRLDPPFEIA